MPSTLGRLGERTWLSIELKRSSLIVAPTHGECRAIAEALRAALKKDGLLAGTEYTVTRLQNTGLTEGQRRDPISYEPGQVVEFHRLAKGGFRSGQQWEVLRREEGQVVVGRAGQEKVLPLSRASKFNLYDPEQIDVAVGDRIRVSKNFQSAGRKFRNNELLTVTEIEPGKITVEDNVPWGPSISTKESPSPHTLRKAKRLTRSLPAVQCGRSAIPTSRNSTCPCLELGLRSICSPIPRLR